jgi:hypothetical protein
VIQIRNVLAEEYNSTIKQQYTKITGIEDIPEATPQHIDLEYILQQQERVQR